MSDPKDINPFPETEHDAPKDLPPLTAMSLSVRTVVNHKENKREVVCATARIWSNSEFVSLPIMCFWLLFCHRRPDANHYISSSYF